MATITERKRKRGTVYKAEVALKGYPRKSATFDRRSDAVRWGEDVEHALLNNLPLPGEELPLDDKSIEDAVKEYLLTMRADKNRSANTKRTDEGTGDRLITAFPKKSLRTLTREDIEEHRDNRLRRVGPASVRHDMSMLSRIYEMARIKWRLADLPYPGRDIKLPAPPPNRKKVVAANSFARLFAECGKSKNETLLPLVRLMLNTGMRPSEACLLRWHQVNMEAGYIDLTRTKTEPRMVPLSTDAVEMLTMMRQRSAGRESDLLFMPEEAAAKPKPSRFFRRAFEQACIRAGLNPPARRDVGKKSAADTDRSDAPRVTLYTLRHSAATYLLENGVDIRMVSAILGHSNLTQTMRYTHPGMKALQQAVNIPGLPWQKTPSDDYRD
ncbi:MAG: tyrosine-type recombinase/integrase [Desulfopila sp.]